MRRKKPGRKPGPRLIVVSGCVPADVARMVKQAAKDDERAVSYIVAKAVRDAMFERYQGKLAF